MTLGIMATRLIKNAFSLMLLLGVLAACAAVPVQEMSDARQAVEAARRVTSASQDSPALRSAEALLQNAEQALAEGNYKQARKDAEAARQKAMEAQASQDKSSKE
jgi:Tfp pilus assembly protein PilX